MRDMNFKDKMAGCIYGALVGDLFEGIDDETLKPILGDEFSRDVQDCIRYMDEYVSGRYPVVEYIGHGVVTLMPDVLLYRRAMLNSALGEYTGHFYPQPYLAACQAVYDTVYGTMGAKSWVIVKASENDPQSGRELCNAWNNGVEVARDAQAFPDAIVLQQPRPCYGSTVGMLAGARFGLHSIAGAWLAPLPVDVKKVVGNFINFCLDWPQGQT